MLLSSVIFVRLFYLANWLICEDALGGVWRQIFTISQ
jgi:hypothetical protein